MTRARIEAELVQLRQFHPDLEHKSTEDGDWFLLPKYPVPPGWRLGETEIPETPVCFFIGAGHPAAEPYGFLAPSNINFKGAAPENTAANNTAPFGGVTWLQFSWSPDGWFPEADARKGSNLVMWVRSFTNRLKEGA